MRIYNSLETLLAAAKKDTSHAVVQALESDYAKSGLAQAIEESVYSHYDSFSEERKKSPFIYTPRREDGGLSDPNNMHAVIYDELDELITGVLRTYAGRSLSDRTKPGANYFDAIDNIVVSGENYSWRNSEFFKSKEARDFYAYALANGLISKDELINLIQEVLKTKGW